MGLILLWLKIVKNLILNNTIELKIKKMVWKSLIFNF